MRLSKLFLASLVLIVACLIPTSAFAQSNHAAPTAHASIPLTNPACYGDGLPHNNPPIQACDGKNQNICPTQYLENTKAIGSNDGEGTIGQLQFYYSPTNANGCNAWHAAVTITHTGCYLISSIQTVENGVDGSAEGVYTGGGQICKGQFANTNMTGDFQPGGCYYAFSNINDASGNNQFTVSATFCYQGTH